MESGAQCGGGNGHRQLPFLISAHGLQEDSPEVEKNCLEDAQGHWLKVKKMVGRLEEKTMKTEEVEKVPWKVTEIFCSLVSDLPRKGHTLCYRAVG